MLYSWRLACRAPIDRTTESAIVKACLAGQIGKIVFEVYVSIPRNLSVHTPAAFSHFGAYLRFLRRRARLTQRELAIAVNYSEGQICHLERGRRAPELATLAALFVPALQSVSYTHLDVYKRQVWPSHSGAPPSV